MVDTTGVVDNPFAGWVTMKEAGEIVDRDHSTIRLWVRTGKIRAYRIGSSTVKVVNVEEVKAYSDKAMRVITDKRPRRSKSKSKKKS